MKRQQAGTIQVVKLITGEEIIGVWYDMHPNFDHDPDVALRNITSTYRGVHFVQMPYLVCDIESSEFLKPWIDSWYVECPANRLAPVQLQHIMLTFSEHELWGAHKREYRKILAKYGADLRDGVLDTLGHFTPSESKSD